MGIPELGSKRTCADCGGRFYDLNRFPGMCPKCGAEQPPEKPRAVRPQRSSFSGKRPPVPVFAADAAEPASLPDADDLDEEDDDVATEPDEDSDEAAEIGPVHHEEPA
jgi:uncharacterized protein (TIGR02300 family)